MYCINCGTKLEENNKFCPNCGTKTSHNNHKKTKNKDGATRKAIKKEARLINKTPLVLIALIYFIIITCLSVGTSLITSYSSLGDQNVPIIIDIVNIFIILLFGVIITFGIAGASVKTLRGEKITLIEVIKIPFKNIQAVLLFYLMIFLLIAAYILLMFIPGVNLLVSYISIIGIPILFIYFYPVLDMYMYLTMDDTKESLSFAGSLKEAYNIVKGHRVEYYGMTLSFIGWWLLGPLTLGILYIWLLPYVKISIAGLYLSWTKEKQFKGEEQGISNGAVIGITVGSYFGFFFLLFIIIMFLALIGVIDDSQVDTNSRNYNNYYHDYDHDYYDDYYGHHDSYRDYQTTDTATLIYGDNKISFKIPDGFVADNYNTASYQTYTKKTSNNEETITYSIAYSYGNYYENAKNDIKEQFSSDYYNYTEEEYTINLNNKETKCYAINVTNTYGITGKFTEVFYPVSDTRYITIEIDSENVNQNNIKDYVQIK